MTTTSSYAPTINDQLVTFHSSYEKEPIYGCNNKRAFYLKEPLKIYVPKSRQLKTKTKTKTKTKIKTKIKTSKTKQTKKNNCVIYSDPAAKQILLHNLAANKRINVNQIIPPKQSLGNCWMNTWFVSFFISDKGRKFFHFFRQLMIEGKLATGSTIEPKSLRDAFALLNYAIESAIMGTPAAYEIDTNGVIKGIYKSLSSVSYHSSYISKLDEGGNPIRYYYAIIDYLNGLSKTNTYDIQVISLFIMKNGEWKDRIQQEMLKHKQPPHVIVIEIPDEESKHITDRPLEIDMGNNIKYKLDSCIVRDVRSQLHFCALITCEGKEMGYDGMSFGRFKPVQWKTKYLNSPKTWSFKGSTDDNEKIMLWSFRHGYQMLLYYRV